MVTTEISFYSRVNHIKSKDTIPFDIFLERIQSGYWQDIVIPIRTIMDDAARNAAKQNVPSVTVSGKFKRRYDNELETHSGLIAIDIDNCDPEEMKSILCVDRHVVAAFTSIGGRGLCLVFKINPERHREAFTGISEYLYNNYQVIIDPTSINVSRSRFVSFDPDIYVAEKSDKFTYYPKNKEPKKLEKAIWDPDDFSMVLKQIVEGQINLCENYHEWLRIGFAFVHKFGEGGRQYFHIVSQFSRKYDSAICDKQYTACLKHSATNITTISTFYYYCKIFGLSIYSERTRKIAYTAAQGKKSGLSAVQIEENLAKFEDIVNALPIIQQVIDNNIQLTEDTLLDQLEIFLRQNYPGMQRNLITRYIEFQGQPLQQKDLNSIFVKAKKVLPQITYELIDRLINSEFVQSYDPFIRYIQEQQTSGLYLDPYLHTQTVLQERQPSTPQATKLFSSVNTPNPDYLLYFGRKWLVSIIASIYGQHSPLMLVLSGDIQNTGKTEWFRRLLPAALQSYYSESKLDAGKDDEILMTQKLIIMDDEMGGKSKKEFKFLKEITSKQVFSLREPYGRNNVDLRRLAVLCGTTNDNEILSDPTGNRRIIPIHVESIDHDLYNSVDKAALFMEAYYLWKTGWNWKLTKEDIAMLNTDVERFEETVLEAELLAKYFTPGTESQMMASEIKVYIETKTAGQKLNLRRLGQELKRQGFEKISQRRGSQTRWVYFIHENIGTKPTQFTGSPGHTINDVPF